MYIVFQLDLRIPRQDRMRRAERWFRVPGRGGAPGLRVDDAFPQDNHCGSTVSVINSTTPIAQNSPDVAVHAMIEPRPYPEGLPVPTDKQCRRNTVGAVRNRNVVKAGIEAAWMADVSSVSPIPTAPKSDVGDGAVYGSPSRAGIHPHASHIVGHFAQRPGGACAGNAATVDSASCASEVTIAVGVCIMVGLPSPSKPRYRDARTVFAGSLPRGRALFRRTREGSVHALTKR